MYHYIKPEIQLITFIRAYHIVKFMREQHFMRYNRITEILKSVTQIQLSPSFLLKSYFLKAPTFMLLTSYLVALFILGYIGTLLIV